MLTGPSRSPASGNPAKQLVVLLHGLGADGNDLIGLADQWATFLPDAAFVSPHAPEPCDGAPMGYQWFSVHTIEPDALFDGIVGAAPRLNAFIDAQLSAYGLTDESLALVGFSQGTMMSLYVAPRRPVPCACVIGYSGTLARPDRLPGETVSRPPVLLVHGDSDPILPTPMLSAAADGLKAADIPVHHVIRPGLAHGIDGEGAMMGAAFLRHNFGL